MMALQWSNAKNARVPDDVRQQVVATYEAGLRADECARSFQLGLSTVQRIITEAGVARRKGSRTPRVQGVVVRDRSASPVPPPAPKEATAPARAPEKGAPDKGAPETAPGRALHPIHATGGRWEELRNYASVNGISVIEAQKLWHRAVRGLI